MRRLAAARGSEAGLQILTLPFLAARLAGGFRRPARSRDVEPAIRLALDAPGLGELEAIRELPGMTRSVAWTLSAVWDADLSLSGMAHKNARLGDLALSSALPAGVLTPPDLRDAAMARLEHAAALLTAVTSALGQTLPSAGVARMSVLGR